MDKQKVKFIHADSIEELEKKTNELIKEGYRLHGNVIASNYVFNYNEVYYYYIQAMVLEG